MDSGELKTFEKRKQDHIRIALLPESETFGRSGFDRVHIFHDAIPELSLNEINLSTVLFGHSLQVPYFISGMTAGHEHAPVLNYRLAQACSARGWAMGVGSQRRELNQPESARDWELIRKDFPELVLFSNIGLSQVIESWKTSQGQEKILNLANSLGAQVFVIHLNSLQEALQPEGTPYFTQGLDTLREVLSRVKIPVVLKETGSGISPVTARKLFSLIEAGLSGVDVSGLGGTHWGRIEGARSPDESILKRASETFSNWGESTVDSILHLASDSRPLAILGSGGVRSGLDAAKCIALGCEAAGFAKPALQAALTGSKELLQWMELMETELKIALFCSGSKNVEALRGNKEKWKIKSSY